MDISTIKVGLNEITIEDNDGNEHRYDRNDSSEHTWTFQPANDGEPKTLSSAEVVIEVNKAVSHMFGVSALPQQQPEAEVQAAHGQYD